MEDENSTYHSAKTTQAWHQENGIEKLWWPSQSPDMNPIEHIWHILDLAIRKRTLKAANKEVLLQYIQKEWEKIPMTKVAELELDANESQAPCTSPRETNKVLKCYFR